MHKYKAKPQIIDGIWFASTAEARRYQELLTLERVGKISALKRQPRLTLSVDGRKICTYVADSSYIEGARQIIEDVKGVETQTFKLKWALAKALYPEYDFRLYKGRA